MSSADTPMFQQYRALKASVGNALLLYRMGDFYELFFDDARVAADVLDLTLTTRNKADPEPIPMAGVPWHAVGSYVDRLVEAGHRVAIAEQAEDPALAKGLVRREVRRLVTPGLAFDATTIDATIHHWVAAVGQRGDRLAVALLDASTGDLRVLDDLSADDAAAALRRAEPREVLTLDGRLPGTVERALKGVARAALTQGETPPPVGTSGIGGRCAAAAIAYAAEVLRRPVEVRRLDVARSGHHVVLDDATRNNLELVRSLRGGTRAGSLLALLDRTKTAPGARLLREWLLSPLVDVGAIALRQCAVGACTVASLRDALRRALDDVADVDRVAVRTQQGAALPRDLVALRRSLMAAPALRSSVAGQPDLERLLPTDDCPDVAEDLARWLVDDPPATLADGGFIARGADPELDALVTLATEGLGDLSALEDRLQRATGIGSLKVRSNRVFGFYIEVTNANLARVPETWIRRQTVATGERFITPELKELEERVLSAGDRRRVLERAHFDALVDRVAAAGTRLATFGAAVATLDVVSTLAEVSVRRGWVRPTVDDGTRIDLVASRHPVVEAFLEDGRFVPNDVVLDLDAQRLCLLTGPNMGGKSTVLRQVAITVLLAQMGCFVPAERAVVGVCDRVFTRVGASDDLVRGQSTFMVEMSETASILSTSTSRSLVVLDEIGRGTSTWDGLAIAWAVAEDLARRVGCRALFATHYHELCGLADQLPGVFNQHVAVAERQGEIVFLHRLASGGASRSYGIQCARLAGLPPAVIDRASALLARFETTAPHDDRQQLSLFGTAVPAGTPMAATPPPPPHPALVALSTLDPDAMAPREALDALYQLRGLLS